MGDADFIVVHVWRAEMVEGLINEDEGIDGVKRTSFTVVISAIKTRPVHRTTSHWGPSLATY